MVDSGVSLLLLWFRGVLVCFGVGPWRCGARKVGVLAARHASLLESSRVECELNGSFSTIVWRYSRSPTRLHLEVTPPDTKNFL